MAESTTPGLTERMRRFTDTLEERDFDTALGFFGPDPEWDMSAMGMGTFSGPVAIRGLLEDWTASYAEWEIEFNSRSTSATASCSPPFSNGVARREAPAVSSCATWPSGNGLVK
jgi:limonene-1,2-epoxide hydrolase